jgi:hypothetical protein
VKGKERLITSRSGVYGWSGDRDLHFVWLFDGRGVRVAHRFLTTADSLGVRTRVDLAEGQCAVVRRIPVHIESAGPVNLHVSQYGDKGCELVASGRGPATLTIGGGDFSMKLGAEYVLRRNGVDSPAVIATRGTLSFPLPLADDVRISIRANQISIKEK